MNRDLINMAYNITDQLKRELEDLAKALTEKYFYEDAECNGEWPFVADYGIACRLRLHCPQTMNLIPRKSMILEMTEVIEEHGFQLVDWWSEWKHSPLLKGRNTYRKGGVNPYRQFLSLMLEVEKERD